MFGLYLAQIVSLKQKRRPLSPDQVEPWTKIPRQSVLQFKCIVAHTFKRNFSLKLKLKPTYCSARLFYHSQKKYYSILQYVFQRTHTEDGKVTTISGPFRFINFNFS